MVLTKISGKINFIGGLLSLIVVINLALTIYLNKKQEGDSYIINIAGKQRMLSQKITKEIFYMQNCDSVNFEILNTDIDKFEKNLFMLINGNKSFNITPPPTKEIKNKLKEVLSIWKEFKKRVLELERFRLNNIKQKDKIKQNIHYIHKTNIKLLNSMDEAVWLYTQYSENKINMIKNISYIVAVLALLIILFTYTTAKMLEKHVKNFVARAKELSKIDPTTQKTPLRVDSCSEDELKEVSSHINKFADKVKNALNHSNDALKKAELAASELQVIADNIENVLEEIGVNDKKCFEKDIDTTEDIAIESAENLIKVSAMIKKLQKNLENISELSTKKR